MNQQYIDCIITSMALLRCWQFRERII